MTVETRILANTYYDSVFLMGIAGRLGKQPGILRTAALMGTPKNKLALVEFGAPEGALEAAGPTDLVLAADAATPSDAAAALALVDGWLQEEAPRPAGGSAGSFESAVLQRLPDANLAIVSVPGEYAAFEARRALDKGLHVFLFSDNVSLADEIALKREAAEQGLLVMGPDCGTSIICGTGIGFANVVRRGAIGIVGPSGTGIQQVSSLIHNAGAGVSHAIGTGSHDLSDEVGGVTTFSALGALAEDPETRVIVIVSKPPGTDTHQRVLKWIASSAKPVVTCFLGLTSVDAPVAPIHHPVETLAAAAGTAVAVENGSASGVGSLRVGPPFIRAQEPGFVRGLFAGGTFCYEAQQIFLTAGVDVRSNAPLRTDLQLASPLRSEGHSLIDLGDDQFTQGRPHPMIDATLRNERILTEAADPRVSVLLLDFILGYGAAADPAGDALPAIAAAQKLATAAGRRLTFVASVCGTDDDPQNRSRQISMLEAAGVCIAQSSTDAAAVALAIANPAALGPTAAGKERG